jgi:inner membrane protein
VPTTFSHPAVPWALTYGLGPGGVCERLVLTGAAASILPDLDVFAFRLGIPYDSGPGHRGFSHSLAFGKGGLNA